MKYFRTKCIMHRMKKFVYQALPFRPLLIEDNGMKIRQGNKIKSLTINSTRWLRREACNRCILRCRSSYGRRTLVPGSVVDFQDLQDLQDCTPLETQNFTKTLSMLSVKRILQLVKRWYGFLKISLRRNTGKSCNFCQKFKDSKQVNN